jgi:putative Mg2+ transporter-C (MgtC) family protein
VAGAAIIVAGNGFLHPLATRMDRLHFEAGREHPPVEYVVEVVCQREALDEVRASLVDAVRGPDFRLNSISLRDTDTPNVVQLRARVVTAKRDDVRLQDAIRRLGRETTVRGVGWSVENEAAADWAGRGSD